MHNLWFSHDIRVASLATGQVQYYCTSGSNKDGPSPPPRQGPPTPEKVLAGPAQAYSDSPGKSHCLSCVGNTYMSVFTRNQTEANLFPPVDKTFCYGATNKYTPVFC